jgi:hypothetical protein
MSTENSLQDITNGETREASRELAGPGRTGRGRSETARSFAPAARNDESDGERDGHEPAADAGPRAGLARPSFEIVLAGCDVILTEFRRGRITSGRALTEISDKLDEYRGDAEATADAFDSFVAAVHEHTAGLRAAAKRGRARTPQADELRPRRAREEERVEGSVSDDERASKKPKPDESKYPWVLAEEIEGAALSANLAASRDLLQLYSVDPKATKRSLVNSANCPEFPDAEWTNIIAGRAVNLNVVLGDHYSTANNDLRSESVGDIKISYGTTAPSKTVSSNGEWSIAWQRASEATAFAFPNRKSELLAYTHFITSMFGSTNPLFHTRIIALDCAIRRRVGSTRNVELSNHTAFADLQIAHMAPIGIAFDISPLDSGSGKSSHSRGISTRILEPCHRWNDGSCTQSQDGCRRLHICSVCKQGGHKASECKRTEI